jgi:hypothetical protein
MSIGPMGMIGSAAGSPLAQGQGDEVHRAQQGTANTARQTRMNEKAEEASGVGQTEQDEEASDRDADGRRPWEIGPESSDDPSTQQALGNGDTLPQSKDPTGQCGQQLDLSG